MDKSDFQRVIFGILERGLDHGCLEVLGTDESKAEFISGLRRFDPKLADLAQKMVDTRKEMYQHVCSRRENRDA
jgi:hypothetical protein